MATRTYTTCTKHEINNNNIDTSVGSTMSVGVNVYGDSALSLMREGFPLSPPNVIFDENENKVLVEEEKQQQMPSKWLTEKLDFLYETSYSSSSLSSHSSSLSSSLHSSRSNNLSTRRKKSSCKRNNFYANEDTKHKHWSKQDVKIQSETAWWK